MTKECTLLVAAVENVVASAMNTCPHGPLYNPSVTAHLTVDKNGKITARAALRCTARFYSEASEVPPTDDNTIRKAY